MTIQREYTLPNCKLLVEGLMGDPSETTSRPLLSTVTNVECRFVGHDAALIGGRSLLEELAQVVSQYAQEILSGVPHPSHLKAPAAGSQESVRLERLKPDVHQLTVVTPEQPEAMQVKLGTVELFDLVEAIDQLLFDTQTLPDLALSLSPVSRQYVQNQEPLAKRVVPAAVGLAGLAVAAIALFFLPLPAPRVEPTPEPTAQESPAPTPTPGASPEPAATPAAPPEVTPVAPPEAEASPAAEASPETATDAAEVESLDAAIANGSVITDLDQLAQIQQQLRTQLDAAWDNSPDFSEDLVYQVRVAQNGDILGFRYTNDAAVENLDQVPLRDLQYNSTNDLSQEASAEFRVVFTAGGVVQVSPWYGRPQ